MRRTRWSLFTLTVAWVASIDQRRKVRNPEISILKPLINSRSQVWRNPARLNGTRGNILTLCTQYRDPNWSNCWIKDTSRFRFNGLTSTKTSINDAKVVLMLLRCSKVDWSAVETWRKPLAWERTLQHVTLKDWTFSFRGLRASVSRSSQVTSRTHIFKDVHWNGWS